MKTRISTLVGSMALGLGLSLSLPASALVMITAEFEGTPTPNDCSGLFGGTGGVICDVGFALDPKTPISPIIAKKDVNDDGSVTTTTNPNFTTITGTEFSFSYDPETDESGTWSYVQGVGDPDVRYWVAKDGDGFILHWMINEADVDTCTTAYTFDCLKKAVVVTSGSWATLGKGLSHLTWYDTNGGGGDDDVVPEPGVLFLMGAGLLGLGMARRRKSA